MLITSFIPLPGVIHSLAHDWQKKAKTSNNFAAVEVPESVIYETSVHGE